MNASVRAGFLRSHTSTNNQGVITSYVPGYSHFLTRPQGLAVPAQGAESLTNKKDFSEFSAEAKVFQQDIACRYLQYTLISKGFLINFRKADGIFPFHYFW
ncbi:MAG: hypothetical protein Q7J05_00765 [Paludibacter sp.]|nr:hypothetical protein [Paludibacter sp.]